jgi:hypothetical protein
MLLIAASVMTEYRIKICDHLVTSGDQNILSGDISHSAFRALRNHITEIKFNNKPQFDFFSLYYT